MTDSNAAYLFQPRADHPGWFTWDLTDRTRFNGSAMGELLVRREDGPVGPAVRLRMLPEHRHSNVLDAVHGGVTLALVDISLFAALRIVTEGNAEGAVTLELGTQFIGAGRLGQPLDAVTEVLRETGRLVFMRGMVMQEDHTVASYTGTVRKFARG